MHLVLYRIGAWCFIVNGLGHLAGEVILALSPDPANATLDAALRDHYLELFGQRRSFLDVELGIGLGMSLAMVLAGVLFLLVARLAGDATDRARRAACVGLAASLTGLVITVALLPPPPIILFALASLAFAAALIVRPARPSLEVRNVGDRADLDLV